VPYSSKYRLGYTSALRRVGGGMRIDCDNVVLRCASLTDSLTDVVGEWVALAVRFGGGGRDRVRVPE
jgi:hypothetical protein